MLYYPNHVTGPNITKQNTKNFDISITSNYLLPLSHMHKTLLNESAISVC